MIASNTPFFCSMVNEDTSSGAPTRWRIEQLFHTKLWICRFFLIFIKKLVKRRLLRSLKRSKQIWQAFSNRALIYWSYRVFPFLIRDNEECECGEDFARSCRFVKFIDFFAFEKSFAGVPEHADSQNEDKKKQFRACSTHESASALLVNAAKIQWKRWN